MSRALLIIACASTLSMSSAAMADHQSRGSVHVGSAVERWPRLTTRVDTKAQHSDQAKPVSAEKSASEAEPAKQAPQRTVRVVYPVP
jgi:hypothetical protein